MLLFVLPGKCAFVISFVSLGNAFVHLLPFREDDFVLGIQLEYYSVEILQFLFHLQFCSLS